MKIKKILIDSKGRKYFWSKGDLHTLEGVVKEKDIKNGMVKSHIGKVFLCFDASFKDNLEKIKRGPAIMLQKDIGMIITYTGIDKNSKVLDAGTGCGVLAAHLAKFCDVVSYERNKEFIEIAKKNFGYLDVNVNIKEKDIYDGIDEKDLDLIVLDLLKPWKILKHVKKSLKAGRFLVCYLPTITQVIKLVEELDDEFYLDNVCEVLERKWIVQYRKVRPENQMLGHTGFLVFVRKI
jgi:tRNA (adenine57-N1/adenine58-N1)-methyltransferase